MDELIGKKIIAVRPMTDEEVEAEGWYNKTVVIELSDGTKLYPSQDSEGNDSGVLFGSKDSKCFVVM